MNTTVMLLAVPLTQAQIDAANRLYAHLQQWRVTDDALKALAHAFPTWESEASLLKVATINQLYGTTLYAVVRMAEHVCTVMAAANPAVEGPELVERIALLPTPPNQKIQWRHFNFASKLAHFFIDSELFPIYDSYAVQMLERHLGVKGRVRDNIHLYQAYVTNLGRLRERSGLSWIGRELDRYLWLAGQYRTWVKNRNAPINTELAHMFKEPPTATDVADLSALGVS